MDLEAEKLPELYKFAYASHACDLKLIIGTSKPTVLSCAASQQDDPLSGLELFEKVQVFLASGMSDADFF